MTNDTTFKATISFSQTGKTGPIVSDMNFTPKMQDFEPDVYRVMAKLASVYLELANQFGQDKAAKGDKTYTSSFSLWQEGPDGDVYSKLALNPKINASDDQFPDSYKLASYLACVYLNMAGVLDEDGNLIDEDALHDRNEIRASEPTLH